MNEGETGMWISGGTVLAVSSRALLRACESLGIDTDRMLADAGLQRQALQDPDARISTVAAGRLWSRAYDLSGNPNLALHAVEALSFGAYRVIDFLTANAPTVGDALSQVSDYFPIINTTVRLPIQTNDEEVTLHIQGRDNATPISRLYGEYIFAAVILRTRAATGCKLPLVFVEFTGPPPASAKEHERVFGCPVKFNRPRHQLTISRSVWNEPVLRADANLYAILEDHARTTLERLPADSPIVAEVRQALQSLLSNRQPTLHSVARKLGLTPRTLQRRLKAAETVFVDLLDEDRRCRAEAYLRRADIAIAEVAYLLGFSEQSAFTRAFKRWTGQSPTFFRRQAKTG